MTIRKLSLTMILTSLPFWPSLAQQDEVNIVEREATEQARKTGFGDLEVDNLHGAISEKVHQLIELGGLVEGTGDYDELIFQARSRPFIKGVDREGKSFLRITLNEGFSYSTEVFPRPFIARAHCYIYPGAEKNKVDRLLFQFYRINYSGTVYQRELRRFIHPNPIDKAQARSKPLGAELELLDNSDLTLESYQEPSTVPPVWEGRDGVPVTTLELKPIASAILNDKEKPIVYDKQVRILNRYKTLLRRIDRELYKMIRVRQLERNIEIERILDF